MVSNADVGKKVAVDGGAEGWVGVLVKVSLDGWATIIQDGRRKEEVQASRVTLR